MYYLAIDIGASSGRHILATVKDGKIETKEIYRFYNGASRKNGHLCWDAEQLFADIVAGMKAAGDMGCVPASVGIDCFGVDFVLLDERGWVIGDTVAYRDERTKGTLDKLYSVMSEEEVYAKTGHRPGEICSLCQLIAIRDQKPEDFAPAWRLLHLPDYFNYLLTGLDVNELTISESACMVNQKTQDFDADIIEKLGLPAGLFRKPQPPMTVLGGLKPNIQAKVGYDCKVVLTPSHDTISAMLAAPYSDENTAILSSGTWSMMACLGKEAIADMNAGFSNPHLSDDTLLHMKGITGLWLVQCLKKEVGDEWTFPKFCEAAAESGYEGRIDVDDEAFTAPDSMMDAIKNYVVAKGYAAPETVGDYAECIYHSLAMKYAEVVAEMEKRTGRTIERINVVGGGSNATYLTNLTEKYTGKKVFAGPGEATAIGNLICQFVGMGEFASVADAKEALKASLEI